MHLNELDRCKSLEPGGVHSEKKGAIMPGRLDSLTMVDRERTVTSQGL